MRGLRVVLTAALAVGGLFVVPVVPAAAATTAAAPASVPAPAVPGGGSWLTYHHDNAHTGYDPSAPTAFGGSAGWVSGTMDDTVLAEPLVYGGFVYAATLGGTVYAFNQANGTTAWWTNVGTPQPKLSSQCGNIDPLGISGTPVIDAAANRIYVAELLAADDLWHVFGINLSTHAVVMDTSIPTSLGTGIDWTIQQDRGALALANGYVYVPFGGRAGDCGPYHGWVFAVPTNGSAVTSYYETPGTGAGFWAAGGVVVDDTTGKVFETSGNGTASGCDANPNGTEVYENDAVVRLSATLAHEDAFYPQDWQAHWCGNDQDLGSATMVLINPTLAFQAGKWGSGFLVDPQSMNGMDGQRFPTPYPATYAEANVCAGLTNDANFGSYAYAAPDVYLGCEGNGLTALSVNTGTPSFAQAWRATGFHPGPPIVAGGAVWAVDTSGGGLYGFNAATGAQIYHSAGFGVNHFTTPSEAGGQIFVGSDLVIREFDMAVGCTTSMLTTTPPSSAPTGTTVTLNATASGAACTSPNYRFWIQPPGGNWTIVQDYSATATYSWTSTGVAGTYHLEVDVRESGSTAPYESVSNLTYRLLACTGAGLTAMPPSPHTPGGTVVLTGSATCPGTPTYRFWTGQNGIWTMVQDYSTTSTYNWNTTGLSLGMYGLEVDVRNQNATASYEQVANLTYSLAVAPCTRPGLTASPSGSASTGSPVTLTASTSGCPTPNYRFWLGQNGIWTMLRDYGTSNTFAWSTGAYAPGTYGLEVDVRNQGSTASYDQVMNIAYTLSGCTAAGLGANPSSPHPAGGTVTLTATSTCPGAATYRFWTGQNGAWTMVQDYSTTNTFSWNTAALAQGSTWGLEVDVRDQGATTSYEKVANITYSFTAAPCAAPTLSGSPVGSAATGSTPVFTASTSGCPTPNYRFWVGQNGIWRVVQDYSGTATFGWNTNGYAAGGYGIEVDVRDASSSVSYDHVANIAYTLNGCTAAHLATDKGSPQVHGTTVGLTGSATCPGTAEYRFWVRQNGVWTIVQDYSASATFSWTNNTAGTYGLEVDIRDVNSGVTYETVANLTFQLT